VGQVSNEKTNVSEPLLTHRNNKTLASKPGEFRIPGTKVRLIGVLSVREQPVRCPDGARCIGGVSSLQALTRNRRTSRLDTVPAVQLGEKPPGRQEGGPQTAETASGRVPTRDTGADRLVVAMKAL